MLIVWFVKFLGVASRCGVCLVIDTWFADYDFVVFRLLICRFVKALLGFRFRGFDFLSFAVRGFIMLQGCLILICVSLVLWVLLWFGLKLLGELYYGFVSVCSFVGLMVGVRVTCTPCFRFADLNVCEC